MPVAPLPETDLPPVLRTDFTDDESWRQLLGEVDHGWVSVLADRAHEGLSAAELAALVPEGSRYPVLVVADAVTFSSDERPLLLVDVADEPGRTFRAVPDACRSAVGNLALEEESFDDLYDSVGGESGVYRLSAGHLAALAALQAAQVQAAESPQAAVPGHTASRTTGPGFGRTAAPRMSAPGHAVTPGRPARPPRPAGPKRPAVPPES